MSERTHELELKRRALLAQSTQQREQLAAIAGDVRARLSGIDRGIEMARSIVRKPPVIAGAIALLSFIGRLLGVLRLPLLALPRKRTPTD
jgi:hypothetical protein